MSVYELYTKVSHFTWKHTGVIPATETEKWTMHLFIPFGL